MHAGGFCVVAHAVEQHGLANAAQADHQHAACGLSGARAFDSDADCFSQVVATSKLRRRGSGARGKGISDGVRAPCVGILGKLCNVHQIANLSVFGPATAGSTWNSKASMTACAAQDQHLGQRCRSHAQDRERVKSGNWLALRRMHAESADQRSDGHSCRQVTLHLHRLQMLHDALLGIDAPPKPRLPQLDGRHDGRHRQRPLRRKVGVGVLP